MNTFFLQLKIYILLSFLLCVVYPLSVYGLGELFFSKSIHGSLLLSPEGSVVGSEWVGQKFVSDRYFSSRPSAVDYNPKPSGASNLGIQNKQWKINLEERTKQGSNGSTSEIPYELLYASGSGVDPHLSVSAIEYQIPKLVLSRNLNSYQIEKLHKLIQQNTEPGNPILGGMPLVNVLKLNLAIDKEL